MKFLTRKYVIATSCHDGARIMEQTVKIVYSNKLLDAFSNFAVSTLL